MPCAPTTLSTQQRAEVETLAAVLTAQQMADYFGIGRTTFFAMLDRDPDVAERYKRGRARAVGAVAQSLVAKARAGNVTAMIFYLKTQGGWRETSQIDHTLSATAMDTADDARRILADRINAIADRTAALGLTHPSPRIGRAGPAPEDAAAEDPCSSPA